MKHLLILILILANCLTSQAQVDFHEYFTTQALRIDYYIAGDAENTTIYYQQLKQEPYWGGPQKQLVPAFEYGNFRLSVYDSTGTQLLYRRGRSTLFDEWQTTNEAQSLKRSFYQSDQIPFPKHPVVIKIERRQRTSGQYQVLSQRRINPNSYFITRESPYPYEVAELSKQGPAANHADIVFLPDGYTAEEMEKFIADARRIMGYLFTHSPFQDFESAFNFYAIKAPSPESGTDVPGDSLYRSTLLNTSFYTFDVPRYLTTFETETMRDLAALVPYDHIFVLVNTPRYGGGGFYNFFTLTSTDHNLTPQVSVHEFGHGFAGLGDEYYTSDVAYNDFYPLHTEPWEPNISTRVAFDKKWAHLIKSTTPVPTPRTPEYAETVGLFEGGGYVAKGIYSPYQDCRMKSNQASDFCPVCQKAIIRMIHYYTQ